MKSSILTGLAIVAISVSILAQPTQKTILIFGNSLTAGYGLSPELAFPALLQSRISERNLPYKVINGGLSGETSAGGLGRIDWMLKERIDIFILELGANDGLRGLLLQATVQNLQGIIDKVRQKYPEVKIILAGMRVPPNMGEDYEKQFKAIYPEIARKNNASLIPFLLDGVAGDPELNLADGIHPNVEGHAVVADNVWKILKPLL